MQSFAEKKSNFRANRTEGQSLFQSALPSLPQTLQTELANFRVTKKKEKKAMRRAKAELNLHDCYIYITFRT